MKKNIKIIMLIMIISVIAYLSGCVEQSTAPVAPSNQGLPTFLPKGTISGKIFDRCTGMAINGAVMSVGYEGVVHATTSDESGSFSFADVPAGSYMVIDGRSVPTGTYTLTASMVEFNKKQTDSTKRYRSYYYYPVTITFTSLVPGDSLGVSGLVGAVACSLSTLSTTVKGTVVDKNIQPVANASIVLREHFSSAIIAQTNTVTDGSFSIPNIDNGITFDVMAQSADGSLQGSVLLFSIPCNLPMDSLRPQVTVEQIKLLAVDDVAPFVTSITPANNADVSPTGLQIVYTFSEPIKQDAYTRLDLGTGHGTIVDDITITYNGLKKAAAALPLSAFSWNANFTQLTITPAGLVGSAKYTLNTAVALPKMKDLAGNAVVNNASITGDFEALNFTTAGGTAGPAAPVLSRRTVQNFVGPLDYTGGSVGLEWTSVAGARSYNIYRSVGNGSFELARANVYKTQDTLSYGTLVTPQNTADPLGPLSIRYQVRAVGADLVEGVPSNSITIDDEVDPSLASVAIVAGTGASPLLWWRYTLRFTEPLTVNNAQTAANYSILNPDTVTFAITKADYLGYDGGTGRYLVQLLISSNLAAPAGYSIRALNGVTDLAGNAMDPLQNTVTFSAPPAPTLVSPASQLTPVVGLPAVLTWATANGAVSYRLQVSTNVGFTGIVFDSNNLANPITSTSYGVSGTYLTAGVTYYWRVYATNAAGTSAASATRFFVP